MSRELILVLTTRDAISLVLLIPLIVGVTVVCPHNINAISYYFITSGNNASNNSTKTNSSGTAVSNPIGATPAKLAIINFDDGYKDQFTNQSQYSINLASKQLSLSSAIL